VVDQPAQRARHLLGLQRGGQGASVARLAARAGAEATTDLVARRGRASYVGEAARGVCDPGALTVALFFEAGASS